MDEAPLIASLLEKIAKDLRTTPEDLLEWVVRGGTDGNVQGWTSYFIRLKDPR